MSASAELIDANISRVIEGLIESANAGKTVYTPLLRFLRLTCVSQIHEGPGMSA